MDILSDCLSRIPDADALESLAGSFSARAEMLGRHGSGEARSWADVYSALALTVQTAALRQRYGVSL
jgi:hypothetical protein